MVTKNKLKKKSQAKNIVLLVIVLLLLLAAMAFLIWQIKDQIYTYIDRVFS